MDVKCHRCGDPVEIDFFHDVAAAERKTFDDVRIAFYRYGCKGLNMRCNEATLGRYENSSAVVALQEMLGDDIDGLAAMMEDFAL